MLTVSDKRIPEAKIRAIIAKSRSLFLKNDDFALLDKAFSYSVSIKSRKPWVSLPKNSLFLICSALDANVSFFFCVLTFFMTFR